MRNDATHLILIDGKRQIQIGNVAIVVLDERETAIQFLIQRWQLIDATVQRLIRLAQQLRQKERRERHIDHNALVHRFAQHQADELKQLQMILLHVTGRRWIQALIGGGLEQIQRRIEDPLNRLLEELLEHAVLIDARLVETLLIDEPHANDALHRLRRQRGQLPVAVFDDAIPMHRDQRGAGRCARRFGQSEDGFLVLHILAKQFHAILVRYDVRHTLQQHLRVSLALVQVVDEVRRLQLVYQPVCGRRERTATVAAVQAQQQRVHSVEQRFGGYASGLCKRTNVLFKMAEILSLWFGFCGLTENIVLYGFEQEIVQKVR